MEYLVVCGAFRSGTTIVARMLNEHPEIIVTGELGFFAKNALLNRKLKILLSAYPDRIHLQNTVFQSTLRGNWGSFIRDIDGKKIRRDHLLDLLLQYAPDPERLRYYGDKMPDYTFSLSKIIKRFRPKVIFCIRDPRDVVESQIRTYHHRARRGTVKEFWCRPSPETCFDMRRSWLDHMKSWERWKRTLDMAYCEVTYGSLITNLEGEALRVAEFLGVEKPAMKDIFRTMFRPGRHGAWRHALPNLVLPPAWLAMMASYNLGP